MILADFVRLLYRIPLREWPQAIYVDDGVYENLRDQLHNWMREHGRFGSPEDYQEPIYEGREDEAAFPYHILFRGVPIIRASLFAWYMLQ